MYLNLFVEELINHGHEVTFVTSNTMGGHEHENYTEILIDPPHNFHSVSKYQLKRRLHASEHLAKVKNKN